MSCRILRHLNFDLRTIKGGLKGKEEVVRDEVIYRGGESVWEDRVGIQDEYSIV